MLDGLLLDPHRRVRSTRRARTQLSGVLPDQLPLLSLDDALHDLSGRGSTGGLLVPIINVAVGLVDDLLADDSMKKTELGRLVKRRDDETLRPSSVEEGRRRGTHSSIRSSREITPRATAKMVV
jgi:hypothetical protein